MCVVVIVIVRPLIFIPFGDLSTPPTRSSSNAFLTSSCPKISGAMLHANFSQKSSSVHNTQQYRAYQRKNATDEVFTTNNWQKSPGYMWLSWQDPASRFMDTRIFSEIHQIVNNQQHANKYLFLASTVSSGVSQQQCLIKVHYCCAAFLDKFGPKFTGMIPEPSPMYSGSLMMIGAIGFL